MEISLARLNAKLRLDAKLLYFLFSKKLSLS